MTNALRRDAIAYASCKELGDQLQALEESAGIAKQVEDAQMGPMFPNLDASPGEYFRETEDIARRKVRRLYFAVEDLELRRGLIRKRRECDRAHKSFLRRSLTGKREALIKAQKQERSLPWLRAGCFAAVFVAI